MRPSSGYHNYNFAQRVSYTCLYCIVMLRSHHRTTCHKQWANEWRGVDLLRWVCNGGRGAWYRCSVYGSHVGLGGGAGLGSVYLTFRSSSPSRTITPRRNEKKSNKLTPQPPPPTNTYPTKQIHTPPFTDPLDIPLDKLTCSTQYEDEISTSLLW